MGSVENKHHTSLAFDMDKAKNFEFGLVYGLWTFSMEFIPEQYISCIYLFEAAYKVNISM